VFNAIGNVANALLVDGDKRALIENAIGGSGNDVLKGKIEKCTIDRLVQMLAEVGRHVSITVSKVA